MPLLSKPFALQLANLAMGILEKCLASKCFCPLVATKTDVHNFYSILCLSQETTTNPLHLCCNAFCILEAMAQSIMTRTQGCVTLALGQGIAVIFSPCSAVHA